MCINLYFYSSLHSLWGPLTELLHEQCETESLIQIRESNAAKNSVNENIIYTKVLQVFKKWEIARYQYPNSSKDQWHQQSEAIW